MTNPNQAQFGGSFQQQPPVQQPKGCLGRNWKWMVPVGCLGLILGAVALIAGILYFAMSAIKSSEVYVGALGVVQAHPAAKERLGEPIKDGWFVKGNVSFDAGGGSANFEVPVSGPKNSGTLFVTAVSPEGTWMYEKLDLAVEGGGTVSLLDRNVVQTPAGTPVDVEEDADDGVTEEEEAEEVASPPRPDVQTLSGGELDKKVTANPAPAYPPSAKAARASGLVKVKVTVDETGRVISAEAVSGHPLLREAAVAAARQARFSPTLVDGKPVKVDGVVSYNFVLQ